MSDEKKNQFVILGSTIDASDITPNTTLYSFLRSWLFSGKSDPTMSLDEETKTENSIQLPEPRPLKEVRIEIITNFSAKIESSKEYVTEDILQVKQKKSIPTLRNGLMKWAKQCKTKQKKVIHLKNQRYAERLDKIFQLANKRE